MVLPTLPQKSRSALAANQRAAHLIVRGPDFLANE
jgi:hypothetical protein